MGEHSQIKTRIDVPVSHVLVWIPEDKLAGSNWTPVSELSLRNLGFKSQDWLYDRFGEYLQDLGVDLEEDDVSQLRHFVEMVTHYDFMLKDKVERETERRWVAAVMSITAGT